MAEKINADFEDELHCLFNDDNADKLILRIEGGRGWGIGGVLLAQKSSPPAAAPHRRCCLFSYQ